jgi:5-methyltetrahydropteroyltriglutamate--homocysteine methyltransferase
LGDNLKTAAALPVAGLHVDLVRAPEQLDAVVSAVPDDRVLSLGVIDGRNIWRADLEKLLDRVEALSKTRPIEIAPSCSLLHVPIDLALETAVDAEVRGWLAFATQKLDELAVLGQALSQGRDCVTDAIGSSSRAAAARAASPKVNDPAVRQRIAAIDETMKRRKAGFAERKAIQQTDIRLPLFPTTTIGSFPQTSEVRKARSAHAKGTLSNADYEAFLRKETEAAIRWQEEIGLDVLVHGEFERNDMVQYFGEQLSGFAFTQHAWVQSYGSRRPSADHLRRYRAAEADDDWLVAICPVSDGPAGQGYADWTGDDPQLVLRARRYRPKRIMPADRAGDSRRGR